MVETGLTRNRILSELSKSPHGKLSEYVAVGQAASRQEPEFMARLIAWDREKGQVRDAKVALPVVSLSVNSFPAELAENSFAHIASLGPRELLRAYRFALELKLPSRMRSLRRVVETYLREREQDWSNWQRIAIQHRHTLKELYSLVHMKPVEKVNVVLYGRGLDKTKTPLPKGSVFEVVARLKDMSPVEAAGTIMQKKIPFLVALGALGVKAKEPDLVLALIDRMSATEVVTNTKMLEKLGVKTNPALRGAFEAALNKASTSKANVFKTTRAAEAVDDEGVKEKLRGVQERQIKMLGGIEGNWVVLADMSGSMTHAIEMGKQVAATLAKLVTGKVHLVFFNTAPQTIDVSGMALDVINHVTRYITANGGTSIGCGLQRMLDSKIEIDGIAIVSDGGENNAPYFPEVYRRYSTWAGKEVPVYLYQCRGDSPALIRSMESAGIDMQVFDLMSGTVDYYSIGNLVRTMRVQRYSVCDEIMATPLLTMKEVFKSKGKEVLIHA